MSEPLDRLFVYGTLAPGQPNEHFLRDLGGEWRAGTVRGHLYPNGIGPTLGYPALDLRQPTSVIPGLLFSSPRLAQHWLILDEFEGEGYQRVKTSVVCVGGTTLEAFIYALHPKVLV